MDIIKNITGYKTSKDYRKLWELAKNQSIVCICDYGTFDAEYRCRDIAHTTYYDGNMNVSARGIGYVTVFDYKIEEFIKQCEQINLEWIVPNSGEPPPDASTIGQTGPGR